MPISPKKLLPIICLVLCQLTMVAEPAQARSFLDWLFGRQPAYYIPTGTYVSSPTGPTVTAGYLPTAGTSAPVYNTNYPPPTTTAYSPVSGYPQPVAYPQPAAGRTIAYSLPTVSQPALPVISRNYGAAPLATTSSFALPPSASTATTAYSPVFGSPTLSPGTLPSQAAPYYWPTRRRGSWLGSWLSRLTGGSYYGTGNYYPSSTPYPGNRFAGSYWSSYRLPNVGVGAPTYPTYTAGSPIVSAPIGPVATSFSAPLSTGYSAPSSTRFFSPSTAYSSNVYNAQVTYYRPSNIVDPNTGLQSTVINGCRSYQTQVQRIPSYSFGGNQGTPCPPGAQCPPAYGTQPYGPSGVNLPQATGATTQRPTFGNGYGQQPLATNGYTQQAAPATQYNYGQQPGAYSQQQPSAISSGATLGQQPQAAPPTNAYPSSAYPSVNTPTSPSDQTPLTQPQLNSGSGTSGFNNSLKFSPSQSRLAPRSDIKPIPAPPEYRFQPNTTDDRTAQRALQTAGQQQTIATVDYKTITWRKKTPARSAVYQQPAPVKQQRPTKPKQPTYQYPDSGWKSSR